MPLKDLEPEEIQALKDKHGHELTAVEGLTCWLVFRKPTRHEYDRYIDKITADKAQTRTAAWEMAQSCIVSPGPQALTEAMDAEPAILLANILPALNGMVGDDRTTRKVKL